MTLHLANHLPNQTIAKMILNGRWAGVDKMLFGFAKKHFIEGDKVPFAIVVRLQNEDSTGSRAGTRAKKAK